MFENNVKLLETIIEDNKNTEYGKKYNFSDIKTLEDYKNNVPLTKYDDYDLYIKRMFNGEKNILTAYPIVTYLRTTGSVTSIQKNIPFSMKAWENFGIKPFKPLILRNKIIGIQNNKCCILHIGNYHIDVNKEPPKQIILSEICYYLAYKNDLEDFGRIYGGSDLMYDIDTFDFLYEKIWISILMDDIEVIESIYIFSILQFFLEFEKSYKDIISDIRKKKINSKKKLSEKAKKYLLELPISEERLQYVEAECQKGFDGIAIRLWKNIKFVSGIRSKAFIYENKALDKYIRNIPKGSFIYALSESIIGFPTEINNYNFSLTPNLSFYEFIPYNEENNNESDSEKTLFINEVEKGKCYELVITTLSGFYRYKTEDILKIIENNEKELLIEYCFRKNLLIDLKCEKTTIVHVEKVMKKIDEIIPNIIGFLIGGTIYNDNANYVLILCLDNKNLNISIDELEKKLDYFLGEVNFVYKAFRKSNLIGPSKIIIKNKEEFNKIQKDINKKKSHNKQKFIISGEALADLLEKERNIKEK